MYHWFFWKTFSLPPASLRQSRHPTNQSFWSFLNNLTLIFVKVLPDFMKCVIILGIPIPSLFYWFLQNSGGKSEILSDFLSFWKIIENYTVFDEKPISLFKTTPKTRGTFPALQWKINSWSWHCFKPGINLNIM